MVEPEWRSTTLGELCDEGGGGIQTGPFGSQLHASAYVDAGVPSVMPQNIGDNIINEEGIARVSAEDIERLARYQLAPGDIVYSRRGDVEKRALVRAHQAGWLCGTGCLRVRLGDDSPHDPAFVSYWLGTPWIREWIVQHAVGATMLNLNTSILRAAPISVPEPARQRAIAEVLGALDDKIAANRRIAVTSDAIGRAEYLGLTRTSHATIGVKELIGDIRSKVDPTSLAPSTCYVGLEHIPRRHMWLEESGSAGDVASTKSTFQQGDILFGKLRPYFHKVVSAPFDGICSTDIIVLRARETFSKGYALAALASDEVITNVSAATEGTRMPRASWKYLSEMEIPWPGEDRASQFSEVLNEVSRLVEARARENHALAATRDALLPALMSGKLRVRDAERQVEAVV